MKGSVLPLRGGFRDFFHEPVLVLRVANIDDVLSFKAELDPADREALRKHQYVVIYDGVRQRICHRGFLRERKTVGELEEADKANQRRRGRHLKLVEESES